ncbi:AAA domain-containing protein [Testudinibacter sp. P80/BLE/0925]|uniref:DEAD/DEAH box helicase n=1 Tax=Testudinibacter sp. TW-1 TaxID=3417757 RepID=UPI003D361F32
MEYDSVDKKIRRSRCIEILKFWYKIEFFIPFDLQRTVLEASDAERTIHCFSQADLQSSEIRLWQANTAQDGYKITGYEIYFGIFDKYELSKITQKVVSEELGLENELFEEERLDLEGKTCFAKLKLNQEGELLLDDIAVSAAPWALGQIQKGGLSGLSSEQFDYDLDQLKLKLVNFQYDYLQRATEENQQKGLSGLDLLSLQTLFYQWADYQPHLSNQDSMTIVIRALMTPIKKSDSATATALSDSNNNREQQEEDLDTQENLINIFNSFYIKELKSVIMALKNGESCSVLEEYLTPLSKAQRIDLYQLEGQKQIAERLRPRYLNAGHWPDCPTHRMSLMQQFAINSIFTQLKQSGIFSVNGPPGTGKTTLLRDIMAENIVRRAHELAQFNRVVDTFSGKRQVDFHGGKCVTISLLKESLTGFEMVVASSNNTAVENISKDLPKAKSLGMWKISEDSNNLSEHAQSNEAPLTYLQTVAHNIAAKNNKGGYNQLSDEELPWGLIACSLGNKTNRQNFVNKFFFDGEGSLDSTAKGYDCNKHQSIWHWRRDYAKKKGISFAQARSDFLAIEAEVSTLIQQLDHYAQLRIELDGQTEVDFIRQILQQEKSAKKQLSEVENNLLQVEQRREIISAELRLLIKEKNAIEQIRPNWWWLKKIFKSNDCIHYIAVLNEKKEKLQICNEQEIQLEKEWLSLKKSQHSALLHYQTLRRQLVERRKLWQVKMQELEQYRHTFPEAEAPFDSCALEQDKWQIQGVWFDKRVNIKRSQLFKAALQLHEAWLAEVTQQGNGFAGNLLAIQDFLSGKHILKTENILPIWQSLFMIIPVISSTFASFFTQFRGLGAKSLGWLFIDEAGQAIPQAAVGALWRSQRAVVVGDPLQIEPVFTVPTKLIEAIAQISNQDITRQVAPHKISVQYLADMANQYGVSLDDDWLGCPLRVHRRCVDPMFSIANQIAYQGKMVFFEPIDRLKRLPPKGSLDLGNSAWVDIGGAANNKQSVKEQIELVFEAVVILYNKLNELPPIYIISPFKQIQAELVKKMVNHDEWSHCHSLIREAPLKSTLKKWCGSRIGTVHTFQGKEESIVWLVLGCDELNLCAAGWAASKPNLLNVALTRAKHRFFMIGDMTIWGNLPFFTEANSLLPKITAKKFLDNVSTCLDSKV